MWRFKIFLVTTLVAVNVAVATLLLSPTDARASHNVQACPNAYCFQGNNFCELVYNAKCFLSASLPCNNDICDDT
jgi:hypothetical protein